MTKTSRIVQGLMRVHDMDAGKFYELIRYDLDHGVNYFDTADCYGNGYSESLIGEVLQAHSELRGEMFLQTKCSIVRDHLDRSYYDLSKEHILQAVDDSLSRLKTSYIDCLLLHRPDLFLEPQEIAHAFRLLRDAGKVQSFGVSNFPKETIEYLLTEVDVPIVLNQVQFGLGHLCLASEAINTNLMCNEGVYRTGELLYYMKRKGIALQAWSPFQTGFFGGSIFDEARFPKLNKALEEMGAKYQASKCAVATAFILALGKDVSVVTGSVNPAHVQECIDGLGICLSKEDWYSLYRAGGANLP